MNKTKIFISHAVADSVLADKFVDLLQTGVGASPKDVFCSSGPGLGVPSGVDFKQHIHDQLDGTELAIALITPSFFESAFCLCELGAIWLKGCPFTPLLVEPVDCKDLLAVSKGLQVEKINNSHDLDKLHQMLVDGGFNTTTTARWNAKKDQFLESFKTLKITPSTTTPATKHETLKSELTASKELLNEQESEIDQLKKQIVALENAVTAAEVQAIKKQFSRPDQGSNFDEFQALMEEFRDLIRNFTKIVRDSLFQEQIGNKRWTPNIYDEPDAWQNAEAAVGRPLLTMDGDEEGWSISTNKKHPQIKKAKELMQRMEDFIDTRFDESDFLISFEDDHDYPLSLSNSDFWRGYLR